MSGNNETVRAGNGTDVVRLAYKVPDAAKQLGFSTRQMHRMVMAGEIESFTVGSSRRISHEELVDFCRRRTEATKASAKAPATP